MLFRLLQVILAPILAPIVLVEQTVLFCIVICVSLLFYIVRGNIITNKEFNYISNILPATYVASKIY